MSSWQQLQRRIQNIIARGKLLEPLSNDPTPRAKVGLMAKEVYDGIEYPQDYGFASSPPKGSETLVHFLAGNRDHATVSKIFNKEFAPTDLDEGEVMLYNNGTARIKLDADSNIIITTGENLTIQINEDGTMSITTAGELTIESQSVIVDSTTTSFTGDVTVVGDLTVNTINGDPYPPTP